MVYSFFLHHWTLTEGVLLYDTITNHIWYNWQSTHKLLEMPINSMLFFGYK